MKDPYQTLGVTRSAKSADIKKAYHKLAKKLHPDRNPDDEAIGERFKDVSAAYSILGDDDQRARYDRGEIDGSGTQRDPFAGAHTAGGGFAGFDDLARGFGAAGPGGGRTFKFHTGGGGGGGGGADIFSELFGFGGGQRGPAQARQSQPPRRNHDVSYTLGVSFLDAANGTTKRLTLRTGKTLDVKIPAGVNDGQQIRLTGQGEEQMPGVKPGDALIRVSVKPHAWFKRDGNDIHLDVPITIDEAVLGAKIDVPTISGKVKVSVPKGTSSGARLRLKGKGIKSGKNAHGDQIVDLVIMLPEKTDPSLEEAIGKWRDKHSYSVRSKFGLD